MCPGFLDHYSNNANKSKYEFKDEVNRLFEYITTLPKVYEQDRMGDEAMVYLHYFHGGSDWYITEKDIEDQQIQAFGYAVLNSDALNAELGYINIEELKKLNVELDFYFEPIRLADVKSDLLSSTEDTQNLNPNEISLADFITEFGDGLLNKVAEQLPPLFDGSYPDNWDAIMNQLTRAPFDAQRKVIASIATLLLTNNQSAAVINAEMGTGKTMMAISLAAVAAQEGLNKSLIVSPPHLVYKWRREVLDTIPNAKVVVLNGPDTLSKLIQLRIDIENGVYKTTSTIPIFYIMGRVRMRMGFNWSKAATKALIPQYEAASDDIEGNKRNRLKSFIKSDVCSSCFKPQFDNDGNIIIISSDDKRMNCQHCNSPLWSLHRAKKKQLSQKEVLQQALCQIPTIGKKTAEKILNQFGEPVIQDMLADNIYEFVNLLDKNGNLIFSDKKAIRIERALAKIEFGFGQGGYQATEFIKRYLPNKFFDLLIVDEGHEYKNGNSAQGQAMGVLAAKTKKTLLLTGTLMGGYASDLFYLLWRLNPRKMLDCGYIPNNNSLGSHP